MPDEPTAVLAHYPATIQVRWPRAVLTDPAWAEAYRRGLVTATPVGAAEAADRATGRVTTTVDRRRRVEG